MSQAETMICPRCGAVMNCHAEKPVDPASAEEARAAERGVGILEETHYCPRCGAVASRRVTG